MNTVIFTGRFTADPELKTTPQGKSVCTFVLAVDRFNKKDEADFLTIVAWEKTADFIAKYFRKGSKAVVQGEARTRNYQDQNGKNRKVTEFLALRVEFADSKKHGGQLEQYDYEEIGDDEDLPFN